MKKFLSFAFLIAAWPALAQNSIIQGGAVTNFDIGGFRQDRTLSGASKLFNDNLRGFNPFHVYDVGGAGICYDNALTNVAYTEFCVGHDSSGNGLLSIDSFNGAATKTVNLRLNGTTYQFPFSLSGIAGPNSSTAGNLALWNNTAGSLLKDGGPPILGPGAATIGSPVVWNNTGGTLLKDAGPLGYGTASVVPKIVYVGDSLTSGYLGTHPYNFYITLPTYNGITINPTNIGVPGLDLQAMYTNEPTNLDPLFDYQAGMNIAVIWGGTNDIAQDNKTASQTFATLQAFAENVRRKKFKVIVATAISRGGFNGGGQFDAQNQALNLLIRNNWSQFADGLADFAANTNLGATGAYLNATYFNADGIHLTDTGYALVGSIAQNAITTLVGNPGTVYSTGNDTYPHVLVSGLSAGLRVLTTNTPASLIDATDPTGALSYQALGLGGSQIIFNIAGAEKGRMDNSGNTGLGTTSMQGRLNVASPDATTQAFFSGTTKGLSISTSASGTNINGVDSANATYQPLGVGGSLTIFNVSNVEKGRWTSTGLGIGMTPALPLDVTGAGRFSNGSGVIIFGTPASAAAACTTGQTMVDATYIYTCVGTNSWHRLANGAAW